MQPFILCARDEQPAAATKRHGTDAANEEMEIFSLRYVFAFFAR
jgi:hypothetical protein